MTVPAERVAQAVPKAQETVEVSHRIMEAVRDSLAVCGEEATIAALQTAPMLTQLRAGSEWNLAMASRGALTDEVEGACVLRFPRKPGNRCEVTFVAGDVDITTRH